MLLDETTTHERDAPEAAPAAGAAHHGAHDDEVGELPVAPKPRGSTLAAVGIGIGALLSGLLALGLVPKLRREHALREDTAAASHAVPKVSVALPKRSIDSGELLLPGSVQALQETTLFARTNGYVKRYLVDIGDVVKKDQLLAEVETPELDQELSQGRAALAQARASLGQAKTNREFARISHERYKALAPTGATSQQDVDQRFASLNAETANVAAAEAAIASGIANVQRLSDLKAFARVTAPFGGKVTARTIEVGALVTAGNGVGQALFKVAELNPVRVFINVPQSYAPVIKAGQSTKATVREYPDRVFEGKVTRSAGALDPTTRTMLTEVQIRNDDGALFPGMYAQVKAAVSSANPPLLVATSALMLSAEGTQIAVVGPDNHVHMRKVVLESDYGLEVGIASGLDPSERVVVNPGERLAEGVLVEPALVPPRPAASR